MVVKKIFLIFLLFSLFIIFDRSFVISFLKVKSNVPKSVDLIAIMGGGTVGKGKFRLGRASIERLNRGIYLLKNGYGKKIFLAGYRGEQKIANEYMLERGVKREDIINYHKRHKSITGTQGDILMILDLIEKNGYEKVLIVTSPYHEIRCKEIFNRLLKKRKMNVKIYFSHIEKNGEIEKCNFFRYLKLIFHEFFALVYERIAG